MQIENNEAKINELTQTVRALTAALVSKNQIPPRGGRDDARDEIDRAVQTLTAALDGKNQKPYQERQNFLGREQNANRGRRNHGRKERARHYFEKRQERRTCRENAGAPKHPRPLSLGETQKRK